VLALGWMNSEQKGQAEERHKYSREQRDTYGVGATTPEFFTFVHWDCQMGSVRLSVSV